MRLGACLTSIRSLLHDRPGELFLLIPLFGVGADDVDGELVDPLLKRDLVFA